MSSVTLNLPGAPIAGVLVGLVRSFLPPDAARAAVQRGAVAFNTAFYEGLRREVFPAVRRRLPIRTGRLRIRSWRVYRRGNVAVVEFIFYGGLIAPSVQTLIQQELNRYGRVITNRAGLAAIKAIGG